LRLLKIIRAKIYLINFKLLKQIIKFDDVPNPVKSAGSGFLFSSYRDFETLYAISDEILK